MTLIEEIHEQPVSLRRLLDDGWAGALEVAGWVEGLAIDHVVIAARGTSDNAARYAQYLWGIRNRLPVGLAAPSLFGAYAAPPRLGRALVVGISQSGQSPDLIAVLREARAQGCATLVMTNDPSSPLAAEGGRVMDLMAGPERSVAATKTYTSELTAVAMLSAALASDGEMRTELQRVPGRTEDVLSTVDEPTHGASEVFRDLDRCAVLGRGYHHATAFEWALKLQELTGILAQPSSTADFAHGPSAVVGPGFPVFAVVTEGALAAESRALLTQLREERGARLVVISDRPDWPRGTYPFPIAPAPEWASPIVAAVPAQLFSYHLTVAKGLDPESPRGLSKVTRTL